MWCDAKADVTFAHGCQFFRRHIAHTLVVEIERYLIAVGGFGMVHHVVQCGANVDGRVYLSLAVALYVIKIGVVCGRHWAKVSDNIIEIHASCLKGNIPFACGYVVDGEGCEAIIISLPTGSKCLVRHLAGFYFAQQLPVIAVGRIVDVYIREIVVYF